jgi:hypothetical protein
VVQVKDFLGAVVTSSTAAVKLSISTGTGVTGAVISGDSASAVGGVATFSTATISAVASGYKLVATSAGLVNAVSTAFTVNGANSMEFSAQPPSSKTGASFSATVQVKDLAGALFTTSADYVTLSIKTSSGTAGAVLSGTARTQVKSGVASFTGLSIATAGTDYVLVATGDSGLSVESAVFTISKANETVTVFGQTFSLSTGAIVGICVAAVAVLVTGMWVRARVIRKRDLAKKYANGNAGPPKMAGGPTPRSPATIQ